MTKSRADLYLAAILGGYDEVDIWWQTPNKLFNNELPLKVWETDKNIIIKHIMNIVTQTYK